MKSLKLNNLEEQSLKQREQSALRGGGDTKPKCGCICFGEGDTNKSSNSTRTSLLTPPDSIGGKPGDSIVPPIKP